MKKFKGWSRFCLTGFLALSLALAGCSGDDGATGATGATGANGQNGANGDPGQDGQDLTAPVTAVLADISAVTVPSPAAVAGTVVEFEIFTPDGTPVATLPTGASINFTFAKLRELAGNNTAWLGYISRSATGAVSGTVAQATTQNATSGVENLGGGKYRYTFTSKDVSAAVPFEANLTHRIGMQVNGGGLKPCNYVFDFVPAPGVQVSAVAGGGASAKTRNIATTASCLECHAGNFGFHGSSARIEVEYCVTCHNSGSTDPDSGNTVDMANMIHKIHAGHQLPSVEAGTPYQIIGYGGSVHDYSHVGYPMLTQGLMNCRKCHTADDATTADGDNWKNKPTVLACGACHDDISFVSPAPAGKTLHTGGAQGSDANCASCHSAADVEGYHLTNYATPNNPYTPAGVANFEWQIASVTTTEEVVGATTNVLPVVTFRMKMNGSDMDLSGTALPNGISGGPNFFIAFAAPLSDNAAPADWNQFGKAAGQPSSVKLADVRSGAQGTLLANGDGTFTATLRGVLTGEVYSAAYPANATMRAVGVQGYFSQSEASIGRDMNGDGDMADNTSRATRSVIQGVTGDKQRREVVDEAKCMGCHEILAFHGSNRTSNPQVCVVCHNPSLTSSGDIETSMNLKDMLHGIHGAGKRETPLDFHRGANRYAFIGHDLIGDPNYFNADGTPLAVYGSRLTVVTYPAAVNNCLACHKPGTYGSSMVPAGALKTSELVAATDTNGDGTATRTEGRASMPNATDTVVSPTAAACVSCHDSTLAQAHMSHNGGSMFIGRNLATGVEACVLCHGSGKTGDVDVVHGLK